ncbi:hypothetical protein ACFL1X_02290 [Candidatus Hydrogenedentota bacterium]
MFESFKAKRKQKLFDKLHDIGTNGDWIRKTAARKLAALGFPQWRELVKGDPKDFARLGASDDPRVFAWLVDALNERRYRHAAIRGLAEIGDVGAIEPILTAIETDATAAVAGAKALARMGDHRWRQWIKGDREDLVRLQQSGNPRAEHIAFVWTSSTQERERRKKKRREDKQIAKARGNGETRSNLLREEAILPSSPNADDITCDKPSATPEDALDVINEWYDTVLDKQTSERATEADEGIIKELIEEFDQGYDKGGLAAETLAKIGEPAVPYLIEAIQVRKGYKFAWGTVVLEKMGRKAKPAIPMLKKIANDPTHKEDRRREALETISKIR